MADAFRIAFEQQLMQRKDQALRLAEVMNLKKETRFANWRHLRGTGSWAVCLGTGWHRRQQELLTLCKKPKNKKVGFFF